MKIWDYQQKIIANLIDIFGNFLKGCILSMRTTGELTEGTTGWRVTDEDKQIEYTINLQIKKKELQ